MKKWREGEYIEMTPEEEAQYMQELAEMPTPKPTPEDRLAALEEAGLERDIALIELAAMLAGGGL